MTTQPISGDRVRSVAKTPAVRPPVELPTTEDAFLWALFRGLDEGPAAQRGGWPR